VQLNLDYDGNDDQVLGDVWRGIYFAGKAVAVPPVPPPLAAPRPPELTVQLSAAGMPDRSVFAPGETIGVRICGSQAFAPVSARIVLKGPRLEPAELVAVGGESGLTAEWDTRNYTAGEYTLEVTAFGAQQASRSAQRTFSLARVPQREFAYQMWVGLTENAEKNQAILRTVKALGMDLYLGEPKAAFLDQTLAAGLRCSARLHSDLAPGGREISWEKTPEYYRLDLGGKPFPDVYNGGRPLLGISHPEVLKEAGLSLARSFSLFHAHPAFMGVILTNDDYSQRYGWDFAEHVTRQFKRETGLDAPKAKPLPPPAGIISDQDPWIAWCRFCLQDVSGRFNHAQQEAVRSVRPDALIGPIPGGMQIPLVNMWVASQYPPLNFGGHGCGLISSYYYNTYWQPQMTSTFWMEAGRMGHRDLPAWTMADCYTGGGAAYVRNNFYHTLAGGVRGLAYFAYSQRRQPHVAELGRLAAVVDRVAPIQSRLVPADRKVALLISLSTLCYYPEQALKVVYAYHNLMQAGYSVDLISEEEILSGQGRGYRAIVLHSVGWLRQSVADELKRLAASSCRVLCDATVPFELPGADRLGLDIGSGQVQPVASEFRGGGGSRESYGKSEGVAAVCSAMSRFVAADFAAADIRVADSSFCVGPTSYHWFVNAHNSQEYWMGAENNGAGVQGAGTRERILKLWAWGDAEMAKGDYHTRLTLPSPVGAVYDIANGRAVVVSQDGRTLELAMPRFGGALLALCATPLAEVKLASPAKATAGQAITFRAELRNRQGRPWRECVPVRFDLTAPDGSKVCDNRAVAAADGAADFSWTPAVNDPKGVWHLQVTQEAAGKTASSEVLLP
jgi:hypothetical protein